MAKAYLILANGDVYEGESIGAEGETIGEAVFTTGMGAYMETLTDPSYYGQLITQTFPLIGNYGAITVDGESHRPALFGYIVRELCENGSNFRKELELDDFLKQNGVVGISGVDTRRLTRTLRNHGVMNAMITPSLKEMNKKLAAIKAFKVKSAVEQTTCKEPVKISEGKYRVLVWEQILDLKPDGIMLSNGGGNPADNVSIIAELKKLIAKRIPIFGICLGHQMLAIAKGGKTKKMKFGHRGANQPVKDLKTGRTYVTSQNHGYAVVTSALPEGAELRFINANDRTCEGLDYTDCPVFSVQFHPEACGGPLDTEFLFDRFMDLIKGEKNA